jgi:hypothetical protein
MNVMNLSNHYTDEVKSNQTIRNFFVTKQDFLKYYSRPNQEPRQIMAKYLLFILE